MNYYERHLGDYARDTGHLSLLEHGVYGLLLDRYYATEEPIPADQVYRLARARTDDEKAAVDAVLAEFFALDGEVWRNTRCDAELSRYQEKRVKAQSSAAARWADKPSQCERNANVMRTHTERNALQSPVTSNQKEQKKEQASPSGSRLPADWSLPADWRAWARGERPDIDPDREAASFADYWHGVAGAKGRKADWLGTWRNWIRRADGHRGMGRTGPPTQSKTLTAIKTLEGMKHGLAGFGTADRFSETALLGVGSDSGD